MSLCHTFQLGALRCHLLNAGDVWLDGGAMFGVVARPLWTRNITPDARNRIPLTMRCLLVEHPDGLVLVDTGLGNKEEPKFLDIYGVANQGDPGPTRLEDALRAACNIGVPGIQIIGLIVIWLAADRPELVCMFYLVFLVIAGIGAALFMDNLDHQTSSAKAMVDCLKYRDTWIIGILYVGTFGSFIGFGFAFAQVLNLSFTSAGAAKPALAAAQIAWIGPLLGSLSRPYGGKLADRIGGGKVTLYTFIGMTFGAAILVFAATAADNNGKVIETGHLVGLVIGFIVLFILSGLANGSVYKIIPTIWEEKAQASTDMSPSQKVVWSRSMSGALIGIAGAVGGLGGVGINLVLRASYKSNQSATAAFWIFMAFYVVAAVITWWFYVRRQTVLTTETTDIVVEPAVTDPIAPAPITDDTAETAEQPKVSTTSGTGTLA